MNVPLLLSFNVNTTCSSGRSVVHLMADSDIPLLGGLSNHHPFIDNGDLAISVPKI